MISSKLPPSLSSGCSIQVRQDGSDQVRRLIDLTADGDQVAFESLYATHAHYVLRLTTRILGSAAEAEEIVQDVFLELWRQPPRVVWGTHSLLAWLATVTKYRCWQLLRRRRRVPTQVQLEQEDLFYCNVDITVSLLLNQLESFTLHSTPVDRELFRLMYREDLGPTEISRLQAVPVITVRKRALSLHKRLRLRVNMQGGNSHADRGACSA